LEDAEEKKIAYKENKPTNYHLPLYVETGGSAVSQRVLRSVTQVLRVCLQVFE